ncbi:MAG: T9SS type A sorting domain-containing protein [Vicingaceae bacterium]|nr:T9SS type A sorting domain-containing protein [Vicingaceae bacterium]
MFLKRCFILIITLLCFLPVKSQGTYESIITLYFEDNAGRKDTITFGMSDSATVDIDTAFNEVDIYGTAYDSLDIRIIQRDTNNYECIGNYLYSTQNDPQFFTTNRDLKTDIRDINFSNTNPINFWTIDNTFEIAFRNFDYPITIKADKQKFENTMFSGWSDFKALYPDCNPDSYYNTFSNYTDTLTAFINNSYLDSVTIHDTSITYLIFGYQTHVSINEFSKTTPTWKIQPNPTQSNITLSGISIFDGKIEVLNLLGEIIFSQNVYGIENTSVTVEHLKNGIYFIRYYDNETKTYSTNKLIKN